MQLKEVGLLIPFSIVGVILGTQLLMNLPVTPMLLTLAVFVFIFAVRNLLNIGGHKPVSAWWSVPAALTGGTIGGLFGTGAPPYVIYLNHRIQDRACYALRFPRCFSGRHDSYCYV